MMNVADIAKALNRPYMSIWRLHKAGKIAIVDGQPKINYDRRGRKAKRRETYAIIAEQIGVSEQTAINYDRRGKLVDTGDGWIVI